MTSGGVKHILLSILLTVLKRLAGLVFLKMLRFGTKASEESVIGPDNDIDVSDKATQYATPLYRRLIHFCLKEDVTAFAVEAFIRSICAYNYMEPNLIPTESMNIRVGSLVVKAVAPR